MVRGFDKHVATRIVVVSGGLICDIMSPPHTWNVRQRKCISISGLVVEYIVAIDVTRVRFPADALLVLRCCRGVVGVVFVHVHLWLRLASDMCL